MKLIIRSSYWGNVLKGKPRVDAANPSRSFRTISSQAVLTIEGKYWGCCQGQGKRVLEMTEQHFMDTFPGDWDLYLVGSTSNESEAIHSFFLVPQNQVSVNVQHHACYSAWQYYGTVSATTMRKQLNEILAETFAPNENIGFRYHHVHIEILMSHVTDYAARAKKASATGSGKTSPVSSDNKAEETNENTKPPTPIPGLSKSASHDASATEVTSSPSTCTSYHEVQHEVPQFVHSGSFDQEMICYPVPIPYPVMHHPMPPSMYQTYGPTYMQMHMGVLPHNPGLAPPSAGLGHYSMYHPPHPSSVNPTPMAHHAAAKPLAPQQEPSKELQSTQNTSPPT